MKLLLLALLFIGAIPAFADPEMYVVTERGNTFQVNIQFFDSDEDGIPDSDDECPYEAETINTHMDDDGCPDVHPDSDNDGDSGGEDAVEAVMAHFSSQSLLTSISFEPDFAIVWTFDGKRIEPFGPHIDPGEFTDNDAGIISLIHEEDKKKTFSISHGYEYTLTKIQNEYHLIDHQDYANDLIVDANKRGVNGSSIIVNKIAYEPNPYNTINGTQVPNPYYELNGYALISFQGEMNIIELPQTDDGKSKIEAIDTTWVDNSYLLFVDSTYDLMTLPYHEGKGFLVSDVKFNPGSDDLSVTVGSTPISSQKSEFEYDWTFSDPMGSVTSRIHSSPDLVIISGPDGYNTVTGDNRELYNTPGNYYSNFEHRIYDTLPARETIPSNELRENQNIINIPSDTKYMVLNLPPHYNYAAYLNVTKLAVDGFIDMNYDGMGGRAIPWTVTSGEKVFASGIEWQNGDNNHISYALSDKFFEDGPTSDIPEKFDFNIYPESYSTTYNPSNPTNPRMAFFDERNDKVFDVVDEMGLDTDVYDNLLYPENRDPDHFAGDTIIHTLLYAKLPFSQDVTVQNVTIVARDGPQRTALSYLDGNYTAGSDMFVPFVAGYGSVAMAINDVDISFDFADIPGTYTSSIIAEPIGTDVNYDREHQVRDAKIQYSFSNYEIARNDQRIPASFTFEVDAGLEIQNFLSYKSETIPPPPPPPPPRDPLTVTIKTFVNGVELKSKEIHFDDTPISRTDSDRTYKNLGTYEKMIYTENSARYTYDDVVIHGTEYVDANEGDIIEFMMHLSVYGETERLKLPSSGSSVIITSDDESASVSGYITINDGSIQIG